jgi:hypothetical protein
MRKHHFQQLENPLLPLFLQKLPIPAMEPGVFLSLALFAYNYGL